MSNDIEIRNSPVADQNPVYREEPSPSWSGRAYTAYARAIQSFVHGLFARGWFFTACALGTILLEPLSTLRAGCEMVHYLFKRNYDFSGANPQDLDGDQLRHRPVLCLHGNYHSPAAFTSIATPFENNNAAPLFTVSLNNGDITEADRQAIDARIEEIKALYRADGVENISIDVIGHSRGAILASELAGREDIHKIVLLGAIGQDHPKICEINGRLDCLIFRSAQELERAVRRAAANPRSHHLIEEGHLGLLYSAEAQGLIAEWLNEAAPGPNMVPPDEPPAEADPQDPFLPPSE